MGNVEAGTEAWYVSMTVNSVASVEMTGTAAGVKQSMMVGALAAPWALAYDDTKPDMTSADALCSCEAGNVGEPKICSAVPCAFGGWGGGGLKKKSPHSSCSRSEAPAREETQAQVGCDHWPAAV